MGHHKRHSSRSPTGQREGRGSRHRGRHHRDRDDDSDGDETRFGQPAIDSDAYFNKSPEFQLWLSESKGVYFNDLKGSEARSYFDKFVKRWNKGKLDKKYYSGIASTDLQASQRTGHKWNFKNLNEDELVSVRDSVESLTKAEGQLTRPMDATERRDRERAEARDSKGKGKWERDEERDVAERDREDRHRQARRLRKDQEVVLDELAPRETGREAMLAKRRAQTDFHRSRADRDVDMELRDEDLMGGSSIDAFRAAERRKQDRRAERQEEKRTVMDERLRDHRRKEEGTMDMLKKLAQARFGNGNA